MPLTSLRETPEAYHHLPDRADSDEVSILAGKLVSLKTAHSQDSLSKLDTFDYTEWSNDLSHRVNYQLSSLPICFWPRPTCHATLPQKSPLRMMSELASDTVQDSSVVEDYEVPLSPSVSENVFWSIHFALQAMADPSDLCKIIDDLNTAIS